VIDDARLARQRQPPAVGGRRDDTAMDERDFVFLQGKSRKGVVDVAQECTHLAAPGVLIVGLPSVGRLARADERPPCHGSITSARPPRMGRDERRARRRDVTTFIVSATANPRQRQRLTTSYPGLPHLRAHARVSRTSSGQLSRAFIPAICPFLAETHASVIGERAP
jgi:hypothetical protein